MNAAWILLGCLVAAAAADVYYDVVRQEWNNFKLHYGKTYRKPNEDTFRMKVFLENWEMIAKHNELYAQGLVTYELGINEFADMLHHEFLSQFTGFQTGEMNETSSAQTFMTSCHLKSPDTVDWRTRGAVTPVKNQGPCGSCWAFSTTGSLEAHHFLKTKTLVALSEQNLVDCSRRYGNHGCNGGNMEKSFEYIIANGIDTEKSYPYTATDTGSCRFNRNQIGAKMQMYVRIPPGSERDLQSAIAVDGPVSVALDASNKSFMFYKDGIYYEPNCNSIILNHAVTVVGYGTTSDGKDYWLVKNSWGKSWGSDGYLKIARNRQNHCGIASYALYPIV